MTANALPKVTWYLRPTVIVLLLFFVLGPFGLPLLYRSPTFGRTWKIVLTLAVIAYTFYLVLASIRITTALYEGIA